MFILILLSVFLSCGNAYGSQDNLLALEGPYVLPVYPDLARRAAVNGSFEIEVHALNGAVAEIRILSRRIASPSVMRTDDNPMARMFTNAIEEAVKRWKFRHMQAEKFQLTVIFRDVQSADYKTLQRSQTVYRVEAESFRPPTKIIIEYHRLLVE